MNRKGFTLIELMIVFAIIGILAAIAIPKFDELIKRNRGGQETLAEPLVAKAANATKKYDVERLFTVDGCTVYRFSDGWSGDRFFTNCRGTTSWSESCGKDCTRHMEVQTSEAR